MIYRDEGAFYVGEWDSDHIREVVPPYHSLQILHHCIVPGFNTALFACDSETGLLYTAVVYVRGNHLIRANRTESAAAGSFLLWAHSMGCCVPIFKAIKVKELF